MARMEGDPVGFGSSIFLELLRVEVPIFDRVGRRGRDDADPGLPLAAGRLHYGIIYGAVLIPELSHTKGGRWLERDY